MARFFTPSWAMTWPSTAPCTVSGGIVRKNIGSRPDSEVEVAPSEIIGMPEVVTCLYVFLTTPLDGGPMITDGFLEISDWADDVF